MPPRLTLAALVSRSSVLKLTLKSLRGRFMLLLADWHRLHDVLSEWLAPQETDVS